MIEFYLKAHRLYLAHKVDYALLKERFAASYSHAVQYPFSGLQKSEKFLFGKGAWVDFGDQRGVMAKPAAEVAARGKNGARRVPREVE